MFCCDNRGAVKNMSIPELILHKKYNTINYHSVLEAVASDILQIWKEDRENNLADLLTKFMTGQKRWDLCYHIFC